MKWDELPFTKEALRAYLADLKPGQIQITDLREMKGDRIPEDIKEYGYGVPLLIEWTHDGNQERSVLHTLSPNAFGHERRSDRAGNILLDRDVFNKLPRHVRSLDAGAFTTERKLISLGETGEFFHLTRYAEGNPYALDLYRLAEEEEHREEDQDRVLALADYLAEIHAEKNPDGSLYRRRVRDLVGHGEGIMGLLDSYPADFPVASPQKLLEIEKRCVEWRWRIKDSSERLSQVHGDFHPWNILFGEGTEFKLLDRSRGEWGDPADDVSALTINYLLFSLRKYGRLKGPFQELYHAFWTRYLDQTGDQEIQSIIQPFYAWRALVVANPIWYPDLAEPVRIALFRFLENVLDSDRFLPWQVDDYLI